MRCTKCGQPTTGARTLSTHATSEGWVRYRRCACGDVSIELLTLEVQATSGLGTRALHAARA